MISFKKSLFSLHRSVAVRDAILPRQLLLRCSTSATAPCVALPPASMPSSCVHAVVLRPWRRTISALSPVT